MRELHMPISKALQPVLNKLNLTGVDINSIIGKATDQSQGDVAIPFHRFSRELKKSPQEIAEHLATQIQPELEGIGRVTSTSGFVNIVADPSWVTKRITELSMGQNCGISRDAKRKVVIDYSSPNIAKEMHVGHLRSTVIGDSLVRILESKGCSVIRENHIGDWGTPFGMLIERMENLKTSGVKPEEALSDLGEFYRQTREIFDSDDDFRMRSRNRVVKLQAGDEETLVIWRQLVHISLEHFKEVYELLGVLLTDKDIMGESYYDPLLPSVLHRLNESGLVEINDGAQVIYPGEWVNREGEKLPLIVKKADGGYNYATSDLACIIDRVERLGAEDLIYVVGAEQKQHFEMVFASARLGGFIDPNHTTRHVQFGLVLSPEGGKLKSRSGGAVKLLDLLTEAVERAEKSVAERNPKINPEERSRIARIVGVGAVKYHDLKADRNRDYVFDWDKMLSFEGDTGPYLQYAHARINSIINRNKKDGITNGSMIFNLREDTELRLAKEILRFPESVNIAARDLAPHRICQQLHRIAQAFGAFYEKCPVLVEDPILRSERVSICTITGTVLKTGMGLLGVEAPERM